jgi:nucleoside 2-deoxyribosyltransferase
LEQAFVIMQIGNTEMDKIYNNVYVPVLKKCDLDPKRVDKHNKGGLLKSEITNYIKESKIIVADLTNERPNCYLEVGYAMGLGKYQNLILTAREDHYSNSPNHKKDGPKIHFDLSGYDIIFWNPEDLEGFRSKLEGRIRYRLTALETRKSEETVMERTFPNGWLNTRLPNIAGFCWLSLGVVLPIKEESRRPTFDVAAIKQLRHAVETHKRKGKGLWTVWYCPWPSPLEPQKRLQYKMASRADICSVQSRPTEDNVLFYPDPLDFRFGAPIGLKEPDPEKGEWYDIWFDARGFMLASIGLPWHDMGLPGNGPAISADEFFAALLAMASLFNQDEIKECFPEVLWDTGKFKIFAKMSQFPGNVVVPSLLDLADYPSSFPAQGSEWGGPYKSELFESLQPYDIALRFTSLFLRSYGFLIEDERIKMLVQFAE